MIEPRELVAREATARGFDPAIALAVGTIESGVRPDALGDGGASYGIFQENTNGGAGETLLRAGGTIADLMDPVSSTDRFIDRYQRAKATLGAGATPGEVAAAAQRPADPEGYAQKVNAILGTFRDTSSSSATLATSCPAGQVLFNGVCGYVGRGGFVPADASGSSGVITPSTTGRVGAGGAIDGIPNATATLTQAGRGGATFDPLGGIVAAIGNLQKGAAELVIAIGVLGTAALLIYTGTRKTLG